MAETIKIPCKIGDDDTVQDVTGRSVWLLVGSEKVRFFLNDLKLTHYETGLRVTELNPATGLEWTEKVAQVLLDDVVSGVAGGADGFLFHASTFPILNDASEAR